MRIGKRRLHIHVRRASRYNVLTPVHPFTTCLAGRTTIFGWLDRLEIEDEGGSGSRGSHWEQVHFPEAVISASTSSTAQFLEITLSFSRISARTEQPQS